MADQRWLDVEAWISGHLVRPDEALHDALALQADQGLPGIEVAPNAGKLLQLLARIRGAERILEIGTLAGFSTIWLARALDDDGRLITLELDPHNAEVAQENIAAAGVGDKVDIRVGLALDSLAAIAANDEGPFDLTFIDADKATIPSYFEWALRLSRVGSLIVVDNVVRDGRVVDAASDDPSIQGIREFMQLVADEPRVDATAIQTVSSKGYDGFALALVIE